MRAEELFFCLFALLGFYTHTYINIYIYIYIYISRSQVFAEGELLERKGYVGEIGEVRRRKREI